MIGKCEDCALTWPGCAAATNVYSTTRVAPNGQEFNTIYTGCHSHYCARRDTVVMDQSRQERSCETCGDKSDQWKCTNCTPPPHRSNWTPRPAAAPATDERVDWIEWGRQMVEAGKGDNGEVYKGVAGLLAVVEEQEKRQYQSDLNYDALEKQLDRSLDTNHGIIKKCETAIKERDEARAETLRLGGILDKIGYAIGFNYRNGLVSKIASIVRELTEARAECDRLKVKAGQSFETIAKIIGADATKDDLFTRVAEIVEDRDRLKAELARYQHGDCFNCEAAGLGADHSKCLPNCPVRLKGQIDRLKSEKKRRKP